MTRTDRPVVIVSNDTHIGPRLVEDLRPYCPSEHLDEFDRFAADDDRRRRTRPRRCCGAAATSTTRTSARSGTTTRRPGSPTTTTTASPPACIFHGSMNLEPIPFIAQALGKPTDLAAITSSPASACRSTTAGWPTSSSQAPTPPHRPRLPPDVGRRRGRRRGRVGPRGRPARRQLPGHARRRAARVQPQALGAAVVGLRGPRHAARHPRRRRAPTPATRGSRASRSCRSSPAGSRPAGPCGGSSSPASSSATPGSSWSSPRRPATGSRAPPTSSTPCGRSTTPSGTSRSTRRCSTRCPAQPSEYMASNVFYGASFASPHEVEQAVTARQQHPAPLGLGLPPPRGHLREPRRPRPTVGDAPSAPPHLLRHRRPRRPAGWSGQNAIDIYGLDADALQAIADEIGAPTLDELATPIDAVPDGASLTAFRSGAGGWG